MAGLFTTLYLQIERTGETIPITCIGQANLEYRINEAAGLQGVRVAGVSPDAPLNEAMQKFLDESGATVVTS